MPARDDVLKAIDADWHTAAQIHSRIGRWSQITVRHILCEAAEEGAVESKRVPSTSGGTISMYRKQQQPTA